MKQANLFKFWTTSVLPQASTEEFNGDGDVKLQKKPLKFGKSQNSYILWLGINTLELQAHIKSINWVRRISICGVRSIFKSSTMLGM